MREFGVTIDDKFAEVDARVLKPPTLYYRNDQPVHVKKGVWNVQPFRYSKGHIQTPETWTILSFDRFIKLEDLYNFAYDLKVAGILILVYVNIIFS